MGLAKELMELRWEQHLVATDIAVEAGALERCEFHGEVFDPLVGDLTDAYKLANYKFSHGQLPSSFTTRRDVTDAIKAAVADAPMECGTCAKWDEE